MKSMRRHRPYATAALVVCALLATGCGGDETTTTAAAGESAKQNVDAAVTSCTDAAQQLGGAAGTALGSACTSVGNTAKQALNTGGEDIQSALSDAADSCSNSVSQLPAAAQDTLRALIDEVRPVIEGVIRGRVGAAVASSEREELFSEVIVECARKALRQAEVIGQCGESDHCGPSFCQCDQSGGRRIGPMGQHLARLGSVHR